MSSNPAHGDTMRTNVRLYPWFVAANGISPWLPIFFLLFSERVGFDGALTLSAVYYISVVALEVPSGYASDRFGRRPTLIVSALALLLAFSGFIVADGAPGLATCQALLAAGIAFVVSQSFPRELVRVVPREAEWISRAGTVVRIAVGRECERARACLPTRFRHRRD